MSGLDIFLVVVVALSAVVGLMRGLVREALSLAVWLGAAWAAFEYGATGAAQLTGIVEDPGLRLWAGRLLVFVTLVFIGSVISWFIGYLVRRSVITGTDRVLGLAFGVARGVLVVGLVALALQLGGFGTEPWWRESKLIPYAAAVGEMIQGVARDRQALPDTLPGSGTDGGSSRLSLPGRTSAD